MPHLMVFLLYSIAYTINKGSIMKYFNYFEQMNVVRELSWIFCCLMYIGVKNYISIWGQRARLGIEYV